MSLRNIYMVPKEEILTFFDSCYLIHQLGVARVTDNNLQSRAMAYISEYLLFA